MYSLDITDKCVIDEWFELRISTEHAEAIHSKGRRLEERQHLLKRRRGSEIGESNVNEFLRLTLHIDAERHSIAGVYMRDSVSLRSDCHLGSAGNE